jgi:hypothetical protein
MVCAGCTNQYFFGTDDALAAARRTSRIFKGEAFDGDPIYKGYRAVMVSKQMEEALVSKRIPPRSIVKSH